MQNSELRSSLYSYDLFWLSKHKFKIRFHKPNVYATQPIDQAYPEIFSNKNDS